MSVQNGQSVNAQVTNAAFLSRLTDSDTVGVVGFKNTNEGAFVTSIQRAVNKIYESVGILGENDTTVNNYASNFFVQNGDSKKTAIQKLDAALKIAYNRLDAHDQLFSDVFNLINTIGSGEGMQATLGFNTFIGTGDGVTTTFPINPPSNVGYIAVFVNGVKVKGYVFDQVSITFNEAPLGIDQIEVFYFSSQQGDVLSSENLLGAVNGVNSVFTYTGSPKSVDGVSLFVNGIFRLKEEFVVDYDTKTITLKFIPQVGDELEILYTEGLTIADSYQLKIGTGNGVQTSFPINDVKIFDSNSTLVFKNGVKVLPSDYQIENNSVVFLVAPSNFEEINVIVYVVSKGNMLFTLYRTITGIENTQRFIQLMVQPTEPTKILLDVLGSSFLVYGVDFTVDNDRLLLNNTTRANAVVTNSILRLFFKG